jgi:hypothetical protein
VLITTTVDVGELTVVDTGSGNTSIAVEVSLWTVVGVAGDSASVCVVDDMGASAPEGEVKVTDGSNCNEEVEGTTTLLSGSSFWLVVVVGSTAAEDTVTELDEVERLASGVSSVVTTTGRLVELEADRLVTSD